LVLGKKIACALALVVGLGASFASAQSRNAEDVYKDIQVLKGMPADQLNATMQLFEAALGVGCDYCHAEDRSENTERKDVARKMVEMVHAVNRTTFDGEREVSCFTCHRGSVNPPSNAGLADAEYRSWEPDRPNGSPNAPPVAGPPPAQILDKWIAAIGGMDALNKVTSMTLKGTATNSMGGRQSYERVSKGNNSLLILGNATLARTGNTGWFRQGNGNPRDIRNYELNANRFRDPGYLAKNAKSFTRLESRLDEIRGGVPVYQVRGVSPDGVPVRMWFSRETGNLLRVLWFNASPVGQNMERVDYSDFEEEDGILVAHRAVIRTPLSYQTLRLESIQFNAPVEDSRFTRPARN
jgi:hypothetical protein